MKKTVMAVLFACALAGCSENPAKLMETARFEEQQGNKPHAVQIYEQILAKSPASPEAKIAAERLAELKKGK